MKASKSATGWDTALPQLHSLATSSEVGDNDAEQRSLPNNAATSSETASTTSPCEDHVDNPIHSVTSTARNPPAPQPRHSLSSSLSKASEESSTLAVQTRTERNPEPPYHVSTYKRKHFLVMLVSLAASFSPLSSNIYFPALDLIADTLETDNSTFATSVSIYMVAQGLAPSFWGPLADIFGRRQVLIYTMLLYVGACVGLALSNSFPVLMLFRFLQAAGSSSTISIGAGVIADIASPDERGGFIGTFSGLRQFAMAVGPVLGGIIGDVWGFRAIFWFLVILGGFATTTISLFLPETLRRIAGNGSIPLTGVRHQPLCEKIWQKKEISVDYQNESLPSDTTTAGGSCTKVTWRVFLEPSLLLLEKDVACTLYFGAVIYTVWSMLTSSTSFVLTKYFHLNTLQIGLCFLPNGVGCIIGSIIAGRQLDSDFKVAEDLYRYQWGLPPSYTLPKQELPRNFPLERARLAQLASLVYVFIFAILVYGFSLRPHATLALPLIAQFVVGYSSTAVLNLNNTLTVDLYPGKGASATAVNNLARCLLGAVGVSLTNVALTKTKPYILFLILSCVTLFSVPTAVVEWKFGMKWRTQRMDRMKRQAEKNETQKGSV